MPTGWKAIIYQSNIYIPAYKSQCLQTSGKLRVSTAHGQTPTSSNYMQHKRLASHWCISNTSSPEVCNVHQCCMAFVRRMKRIQMKAGGGCWSGTAEHGTCSARRRGLLWIFIFLSPHKHSCLFKCIQMCTAIVLPQVTSQACRQNKPLSGDA